MKQSLHSGSQYHKITSLIHSYRGTKGCRNISLLTRPGSWNSGNVKVIWKQPWMFRQHSPGTLMARQEPQSAKSTSLKAYSTEAGKAIGISNYSLYKSSISFIAGLGKARLNIFNWENLCHKPSYILGISMINSPGFDKIAIITMLWQQTAWRCSRAKRVSIRSPKRDTLHLQRHYS